MSFRRTLLYSHVAARRLLALAAIMFALQASSANAQEVRMPSARLERGTGEARAPEGTAESSSVAGNSMLYRSIKYAGKYHIMVLHFPIAFLLAAALVQWYRVATGCGGDVAMTLLWFGAIGAIIAAALGWMHAYDSVYFGDDEKLLFWHRWLGTGTASVALIVLLARNRLGSRPLAIVLTLCAGMVTAAAHFGASLVYGADFLKKF